MSSLGLCLGCFVMNSCRRSLMGFIHDWCLITIRDTFVVEEVVNSYSVFIDEAELDFLPVIGRNQISET